MGFQKECFYLLDYEGYERFLEVNALHDQELNHPMKIPKYLAHGNLNVKQKTDSLLSQYRISCF